MATSNSARLVFDSELMRYQHSCFWSLAVVAALITCSCARPGNSRTPDVTASKPSATSIPIDPQPEPKPTSKSIEAEVYLSDDIKLVPVEFQREDSRFTYDLKISYPQINKPRTANQRGFNRYVRRFIENEVKAFRAFCSKNNKHRDGTKRKIPFHLGINYKALWATAELLSIDLTIESFTGYLNSDWFPIPFNYDLQAGKPLKLADIFKPRLRFLEAIADYCVDEFMKRGLNCGGGGVGNEELMRDGTKPKADNYAGWNLARNGLQITFGEYQVGPGCLGLVKVVVPYDHLQRMLRRDRKWLQQLS